MSVERFNRVYAFYQAIPGPEAAELAIFFGYTSNGFAGGILSGLGFVLPGFGIMLLLSWLYGQYGLANAYVLASFHAVQPVVTAMIFLSLRKIAEHGFIDPKTKQFTFLLFFQGFLGLLLTVMRVNFLITLAYCGLLNGILYWRAHRPRWAYAAALAWLALGLLIYVLVVVYVGVPTTFTLGATADGGATYSGVFGVAALAGLLTFGGAYTAIPYIQQEAVVAGQWITNQQFLDGLALANLVPTPVRCLSPLFLSFSLMCCFFCYVARHVCDLCRLSRAQLGRRGAHVDRHLFPCVHLHAAGAPLLQQDPR